MAFGFNGLKIKEAVETGEFKEPVLDRVVERILPLIFASEVNKKSGFRYDFQVHHDLAGKAAAEYQGTGSQGYDCGISQLSPEGELAF